MASASGRDGASGRLRRMFDKLMRNGDAAFDRNRDGAKFLQAMIDYDDPVDLLYRMTNRQVRVVSLRACCIRSS